jgi:YwiC-like protein
MQLRKVRLPKEHGAWAMLYVPFLLGTLAGSRHTLTLPAIFLLLSSVTFLFIARQSLLDWLVARNRGKSEPTAFRMMCIYTGLSGVFGGVLVFSYQLTWLVAIASLSVVLLVFNSWQVVRRKDRTVGTETIAIIGLTATAPTAYYVCRGEWASEGWVLWALCALYFASSVFYVKLRVLSLSRRRNDLRRQSWRYCAFYHLFLLLVLIILNVTSHTNLYILAAFLPVLIRTVWELQRPSNQISLRRIGLLEIAYSLVFLLFITIGYRGL